MSRTFRCKNYETKDQNSWANQGRKTAGYYTEHDYARSSEPGNHILYNAAGVFRAPTKQEYNKAYRRNHGESRNANARSPGKSYRKDFITEHRQRNKHEIYKFMQNPDYEPMCDPDPRNCWWDWR